jgi:NADPH2:quinone reductase
MKVLLLEQFGAPMRVEEVAKPKAAPGQVLIKIVASAVNPLDLKIMAGEAAHAKVSLPAVLGIDMAGTIEAIGEGVFSVKPGDEVYGMTGGVGGIQGSLAEYAAVDADLIAKKPGNFSFRDSAALPLAFITAWEGLVDRAKVGEGQKVLIHGGAGGVGHIAIQLAVAKGAQVFSTVGPSRNDLVERYGGIPIDYKKLSVDEYVKLYTGGEGFDIVFDTVGGATLDASFQAARQYFGHVVSILGWGTHRLAPLSFKGATYSGVFTLYPLISGTGRAHHAYILREATDLAEHGKLVPLVDPMLYSPETIEDAYLSIKEKANQGKVVVNIRF